MAVDWGTIASLATAGGTLVLAVSTFASVRSANRAARAAERSFLVGLQPLLVPSRLHDPEQKVSWIDHKHVLLPGGTGFADVEGDNDTVYLAMSVRNAGNGIAVMRAWRVFPEQLTSSERPALDGFRRHTRDLWPAADQPVPAAAPRRLRALGRVGVAPLEPGPAGSSLKPLRQPACSVHGTVCAVPGR